MSASRRGWPKITVVAAIPGLLLLEGAGTDQIAKDEEQAADNCQHCAGGCRMFANDARNGGCFFLHVLSSIVAFSFTVS